MAYVCDHSRTFVRKGRQETEWCGRRVKVGGTQCYQHDGRAKPAPVTIGELEGIMKEISPVGRTILRRLVKELILFRRTTKVNDYVRSIP